MATLNNEKNPNPTRMYNIGQIPLARLRPERLDDMALKKQISLIQEVCGDIDPDIIAVIFHECDYNIQGTITRIKSGDFEDGGWQTAKPNHKKKNQNNNQGDQLLNGVSTQSDSERSLSQRTSPTPSLRERQRKDHHYQQSYRRGNDSNRRYPSRNYPMNNTKPIPTQSNLTDIIASSKTNEEITPTTSSSTDEYEFIGGTSQSLTFDNSLKKSPLSSFTKHRTPSSIPQEPVSMHPTIQFSTEPIDIQFGDVQWNDSVPIIIPPSNSLDEQSAPATDAQDNIIDRELEETTNRLSSSFEITNNPLTNNSTEETSHLSDQLNDSSQQITSTSNPSPTSQSTNSFLPNPSVFTPYPTPSSTFQREYPQNWNQPNYKPTTKPPTYSPQSSYQLPPQQQFFVGGFPYSTSAIYPVMTSVDPWSTAGFESYPTYQTANYYPTQPQYAKHDQYYDKDYFAHYGQSRMSNAELNNSSQSTKDGPAGSKLSATAASFSQATSPATTFYPVLYTVPTYYTSHQDRTMTYPTIDNRDNRNGAPYGGGNNRNHYHQQQRTHNNSTWHSQQ